MDHLKAYTLSGEFKDRDLEMSYRTEYYSYNKLPYFLSYNLCSFLLLLAGVFIDFQRTYTWGSATTLTVLRILLVIFSLLLFPLFWKKKKYDKRIEYHGLAIMVFSSIIVLLLNLMTGGQSKTMLPGILIITTSYYIVVPSTLLFAIIPSIIQIINFYFFYNSSQLLEGAHFYMCFMIIAINLVLIFFKKMNNQTNRTNFLLKEYHKDINQAKDTVLAIIGHDLKNPLTIINNRIRLLKKYAQSNDTNKIISNIESVDNASKRLTELLQNLLKWALDNNSVQCHEINSINKCFHDAISHCHEMAKEKELSLNTHIDQAHFPFDSNMMETIIRNILANAIKFSSQKNKIDLIGVELNDKYIIEIKDYGIGMESETIKKILSGKNRESKEGTSGEKGTGLGLQIAIDFIRKHKASIDIISKINEGTTFKLTFARN